MSTMKHIAILISPKGERFFAAYGPMVKTRDKALAFASKEVAEGAARNHFGRSNLAFWPSEIVALNSALQKYKDWTFQVEPA